MFFYYLFLVEMVGTNLQSKQMLSKIASVLFPFGNKLTASYCSYCQNVMYCNINSQILDVAFKLCGGPGNIRVLITRTLSAESLLIKKGFLRCISCSNCSSSMFKYLICRETALGVLRI